MANTLELESWMREEELNSCGIKKLTKEEKDSLLNWFFRLNKVISPKIAEIEKIKYDGKLIILDDGSRYESQDEYTSDSWFEGDKVLIVDDEMYKLDELEMVNIEEDED